MTRLDLFLSVLLILGVFGLWFLASPVTVEGVVEAGLERIFSAP